MTELQKRQRMHIAGCQNKCTLASSKNIYKSYRQHLLMSKVALTFAN